MPSARTTLWTDKRTSALSGNYFTVLFVTWTPETMVILDFSCSVRCPQICDTGCSIRWGAFDPKHQLSTNSRNDWDQRWIGKCRKMVGVVLTKFFILRQIYEHRHISCRTTISVFLDLTQPIGQFFDAVSRLCVCQKNSPHLSNLCMWIAKGDFALITMFYANSPREVLLVRLLSFLPYFSTFSLKCS